MRYGLSVGIAIQTANTRSSGEFFEPGPPPLLLRVKAASLLSRRFGLDHSFSNIHQGCLKALREDGTLSSEDFLKVVREFDVISCFDVIPPEEVEYAVELADKMEFRPLTEFKPK